MGRQTQRADGLLVPSNFIRAVRDSGYLSVSTALAELVDNALQASARTVAITIARAAADALPEITVEDDGVGMSGAELETCLRFGGSSRFDARDSFGRFGMGLPAASLSQARHIEVTAWQQHQDEFQVTLDVDAVASGTVPSLKARRIGPGRSMSGCRVRWRQCDRIEYRRLAWLDRALHRDLGRIYRRFIYAGVVISLNGKPVAPADPMLLDVTIEGAAARLAFDPLQYEIEAVDGTTAVVTVRFSMLPVHSWHDLDNATKRRVGIVGQGGVSILRAGREIANGWYLMGRKRKENYDDWWRCEIEFDPALDEHFGITINKQGVRPSPTLREAMEPELESIARLLNARVRQAFEEVKFEAAAGKSCRIAAAADRDLPVIAPGGRGRGPLSYRIGSAPLPHGAMLCSALSHGTLAVTLNMDHPAFDALYQPLQTLDTKPATELRTALDLLLLSFVRSTVQMDRSGRQFDDLLRAWSATYGRMLQKS